MFGDSDSEGWSTYYGSGMPDGIYDARIGDLAAGSMGVVVAPSGLNVRATPSPSAGTLNALARGTVVEILGSGGVPVDDSGAPYRGAPWYLIKTQDGSVGGWVTGEWVGPYTGGAPQAAPPSPVPASDPPRPLDPVYYDPREHVSPPAPSPSPSPAPSGGSSDKPKPPFYERTEVKVAGAAVLLAGVVYLGTKYL